MGKIKIKSAMIFSLVQVDYVYFLYRGFSFVILVCKLYIILNILIFKSSLGY